jgi:putative ABC transport system permease protein
VVKMSRLQRKLLRDLNAARGQFLALTLVLVLGIASFGAMYAGYDNLDSSYQRTYDTLHFADLTLKLTAAPTEIVTEVQSLPGVKDALGRLSQDVSLLKPGTETELVTGRIISLPAEHRPRVNDLLVHQGSYFSPEGGDQVLLDRNFAAEYDLRPGDRIYLVLDGNKLPLEIRGIVTSPEYIWLAKSRQELMPPKGSFGVLFLPELRAREILGMPDMINELCLTVEEGADRDALATRIEQMLTALPGTGILGITPREDQPSNALLQMDLESFAEMAVFVPFFFLLVTALIMYVLLTRVVHAQRAQIGLMRAIGYTRWQVLWHYLSFALLVGGMGSVLGSLLGYYLGRGLTRWYADIIHIPLVEVSPNWAIIGGGVVLGLLCCGVAGILPAWNAAKLPPAEAMRTPPPAAGRTPLLERLFPPLSRLPYLGKIPLRNLFRRRRRTLYTVVGITFAVSLVLSSLAVMDSLEAALRLQFDRVQVYDFKVMFSQPQPAARLAELESREGVVAVEPVLEIPARLKHGEKTYATLLMGLEPGSRLYGLLPASPGAQLSPDGLLLSKALAKLLEVDVGDTVELETATGSRPSPVLGFVKQPLGSIVYISLEGARELAGMPGAVSAALLRAESGRREEVKAALYQLPQTAAIEDPAQTRESISELMEFFYEFVGVMLLFGMALAFAIVFNTVTVNILERAREIATMRTVGTSLGRIGMMLTLENLLMGAPGIVLGVALGYWLAREMVLMWESDLFSLELAVFGRTYAIAVIGMLLVLLLSQIPGIRHVNRLNLARVTKEQVT